MLDIRPTSKAAEAYIWFGQDCLRRAQRTGHGGAKAIRDGRRLVICKYTLHHADLIVVQQGDFTMHPRSGPLRAYSVADDITIPGVNGGGFVQSGPHFAEMSSRQPYPLVDNDHGTFVISINGEELEVEWAEAGDENYGNLWWVGKSGEVLSWKGPPSVQFPIGAEYTIPGLTMEVPGGNSVFGCFIYSDGARLCHGPAWYPDEPERTLIVGACYATDEARKRWLVAMTVTHKGSAHVLQVWRSEDTGKTWQLLNELPSLRAAVTAFISQDGRRFVYGGQLYQIDDAVSSVVAGAKIPVSLTGARTIQGTGGYGSTYKYEGVRHIWPSLSKETDGLVHTTIKEEAAFGGTGSGGTSTSTMQIPVYRGDPATEVSITAGFENNQFTFTAIVNGSYCSAVWSKVDQSKGLQAWRDTEDGCNDVFTVAVTINPQGISATYMHDTAALGAMVISGPTDRVASGQYTVANAVGAVTWANSKGTISSSGAAIFSGCGTATITATDTCGRTAAISVSLPTGVWRLVEAWSPGIATYAWFEYPEGGSASTGGSYTAGGYGSYMNRTNVAGLQWHAILRTCVNGTNPKDLGPIPDDLHRTPPGKSQISSSSVSTDGHCYSVVLNQYNRMTYYDKYEWRCRTDVLVSTITDGYYTYYTYAAA